VKYNVTGERGGGREVKERREEREGMEGERESLSKFTILTFLLTIIDHKSQFRANLNFTKI